MKQPNNTCIKNILFIDIETVSCTACYENLPEPLQLLWAKKSKMLQGRSAEPIDPAQSFFEQAAIYAEFGKIIVIAIGFLTPNAEGAYTLRIKGLRNHDEKALLESFATLLTERLPQRDLQLCAHNGKEFDFPYLCRRMLVNNICLPALLNVSGKKPWEVPFLDTMEMWKFGDRKSFTSLHLLATLFGITSSKEIMEGSEVNSYYYHEKDLDTITHYCMQDVAVLAQLFCRLTGGPTLLPEHIVLT